MIKKLTEMALVLVLMFSLVAVCSSSEDKVSKNKEQKPGKYIFKASTINKDTTPNAKALFKFKEYLEKLSNGKIEVQVYTGGVLASNDEMNVELVMSGGVELAVDPPFILSKAAAIKELEIFDFPFIFKNRDVMIAFSETPLMNELNKKLEAKTGVKILGYYDIGWIDIGNNKRPFKLPKDGKGLKIRTPMAPVWRDTLAAFGPSPIPIAFGEVFPALQQGTIDGVVTTGPNFIHMRFYEALKYITKTHHMICADIIMLNQKYFDSLPPDLQKNVLDAGQYLLKTEREMNAEEDKHLVEMWKEHGLQVYEFSKKDYEIWKKAAQVAIDKNVGSIGKEFYEKCVKEIERIEKKLNLR